MPTFPATVDGHAPYLPVFMVLHIFQYAITNWQWIFTGATHITYKNQNTIHTSKSAILPCFWQTIHLQSTYVWYPLIAVQWHNLHVPITCLNMQSHNTVSRQTHCYLIFLNFFVYPSEVENSKHGTRNTPTTGSTNGMNKDVLLVLNNNHVVGVNWWGKKNNLVL